MGAKQQQRFKHIPQRTCVACRQKKDKRQLTRIVRSSEDGVVVDLSGKRNGRGAYICDNLSCWEKTLDSKILERALLTQISASERKTLVDYTLSAKSTESKHVPLTRDIKDQER